jgi:hypothetical protein
MRVLEYDAAIQHRAGKQHGNADMLSRLGVIGEQEPALSSCEDTLREPPEERGSISLALHGDGNAAMLTTLSGLLWYKAIRIFCDLNLAFSCRLLESLSRRSRTTFLHNALYLMD